MNTPAPEYEISTDPLRLDLVAIHGWLSEHSYWAKGRRLEVVARAVQNSLCFGAYARDGSFAGLARVVTDYATFAWVCDVFVLATADAHELYRRYGGFTPLIAPETWMERREAGPT